MDSHEIDLLVASHMAWVELFRKSVLLAGVEKIDAIAAGDYRKCPVGQWLSKNKSTQNPSLVDQLNAQHIAFHLAAGAIAKLINEKAPEALVATQIEKADRLSKQIIESFDRMKN
jgi:hypothetical protein